MTYRERMPRDTLTKEQIVRTAIELLDDEGLDGLNMRSLGKRLGAAATAVYWHVKNKDDLILLAGDRVWDEIDLPGPDAVGWRAAATALATGLHAMLGRHPWLVQAFGSHLFHGPGKARHDDRSLAVYEAAGFTAAEADRAAATVFTSVWCFVLCGLAEGSLTRDLGHYGRVFEALAEETDCKAREVYIAFPRLRACLETPMALDY